MIDWAGPEARNAPLNAFVDLDRSACAGEGPLAGLTIGVKSNIAVRGLPWTAGMALYRDRIAAADAEVVARLRGAGAAILGTLNMHEAALGATTDNPWFGRTLNPHGIGRTPGGSSGGSGAAVAAGLCDVALGTDTLGSVRIPAAYCGVYGLKPTHGAVSDVGLEPLHTGFDAIGPLARSLEVLERVWGALAAPLPGREGLGVGWPAVSDDHPSHPPTPDPSLSQGGERRWLTLTDLGGVTCEPAVLVAYDRALRLIPQTTTLALPPLKSIRAAAFGEAARALAAHLGTDRHSPLLSPELRWLLDWGDAATPDPALLAQARTALREAIGEDGVLLMPTAPQVAFAHGARAPTNQADFTALANVAGLPALSIPMGGDEEGMPVAIQLVGPPHSETMLIDLARLFTTGDA